MKLTGPIVTLIAGAGLAGVLFAISINAASNQDRTGAAVASGSIPVAAKPSPAPTGAGATAEPTATTTGPPTPVVAVTRGTYVGHVTGAGRLAIVIRNRAAIAYLCDGRTIEAWLQGSADNGTLRLTGKGGARLVGTLDQKHAAGTVILGGIGRTYDVPVVTRPSGLYRATARIRGATVQAGWIVLPDGSQVGLVTTDDGDPKAAPPLDPASPTATVDGTALTAIPVDADNGSGF